MAARARELRFENGARAAADVVAGLADSGRRR
jgi:hypothetical protein